MIDLSPDAQHVLIIVALLLGPTGLWLLYRAARGPGRRAPEVMLNTGVDRSLGLRAEVVQQALLVNGSWICPVCSSLNRTEAGRCYKCRTARPPREGPRIRPLEPIPVAIDLGAPSAKGSLPAGNPALASISPQPALEAEPRSRRSRRGRTSPAPASASRRATPSDLPVSHGVPVMDETIVRRRPEEPRVAATLLPGGADEPVGVAPLGSIGPAGGRPRSSRDETPGRRGQVAAIAGSSARAADPARFALGPEPSASMLVGDRAPVGGATTARTGPMPVPAASVSQDKRSAATESPSICPLLGLENDPWTRFERPRSAHRCHAASIPGRITVEHQRAYCYRAYEDCIRYRGHLADMRRIADQLRTGPVSVRQRAR